ncbi:MAG: AmmeMemoRadiSam system protein A [Actinobacteria bacterium]|nr:MAG: AmmeMemoRadiSam system protein A [Actinomycetota bacterium]
MLALAKEAIENFTLNKKIIIPADELPDILKKPGACFVSLKLNGQLRGCIGTIMPTEITLAQEIITNAINAATNDYRFAPVSQKELNELAISIDVLSPMEKINDISQLNPKTYGVYVKKGFHSGLLLPDLEGVNAAEEQLRIAKLKAGLKEDEPTEIYRFKVERFK